LSYLIILLVAAMVVGPVFWIMPSPRQKRQVKLRQRAMSLGLQVKISDLPQTHRSQVRRESPIQGVLYRRLWDTKVEKLPELQLCLKTDAGYEWTGSSDTLVRSLFESVLSSADMKLLALEYSPAGVAGYWHEKGSEEAVDSIFATLDQLREQLLPLIKE
jgi:hypothetical protein